MVCGILSVVNAPVLQALEHTTDHGPHTIIIPEKDVLNGKPVNTGQSESIKIQLIFNLTTF